MTETVSRQLLRFMFEHPGRFYTPSKEDHAMQYDYVRRTYGVDPKPGMTVTHTVTGKSGVIAREDKGQGHYVQVRFEGQKHTLPCHPTELDYTA